MLPLVSERRQPLGHERRQATDIQIVGVFRPLYFGNGGSQFFKCDRTPRMKTLANGVQSQTLSLLDRQAHAQRLIKQLHLLTHGAHRDVQSLCGLGYTAAMTNGFEYLEGS
jgi:hypothetical protein